MAVFVRCYLSIIPLFMGLMLVKLYWKVGSYHKTMVSYSIKKFTSEEKYSDFQKQKSVYIHQYPKNVTCHQFAIFSSTLPSKVSFKYVFFLPLTVKAWRRVGYGSLILLVGSYRQWMVERATRYIIERLENLDTGIAFIKSPSHNVSMLLSQVLRLYAAHLFSEMPPTDFFLTTDADLWPLSQKYYSHLSKYELIVTNSLCCGQFPYKKKNITMLPMCHIGMKGWQWRNILRISHNRDIAHDALNDSVNYFGRTVYRLGERSRKSQTWFIDQKLASIKVHEWLLKNPSGAYKFIPNRKRQRIIPSGKSFIKTLDGKLDVHMQFDPLNEMNWRIIAGIINLFFKDISNYSEVYRNTLKNIFS